MIQYILLMLWLNKNFDFYFAILYNLIMNSQAETQTEDYYFDQNIRKICYEYLNKQRNDIISNLRTFARHDSEVQYFLNKIVDQLRDKFHQERDEMIEEVKSLYTNYHASYYQKLNSGIYEIDKHLDERVKQIHKQAPYDEISIRFLDSLRDQWHKEYMKKHGNQMEKIKNDQDSIHFLLALLFIITCAAGFFYWMSK